jgi:XTP/dITP diphosphohydrolase
LGTSRKILVASTNPGKVAEIRAMLGAGIQWVGLSDFSGLAGIKEDGATFAENARKKALGYAKATGLWTITDDSGLVIVKSARFCDSHRRDRKARGDFLSFILCRLCVLCVKTLQVKDKDRKLLDHKNMAKVLKLLEGVPKEKRTARFVCRLCLASPIKVLVETEGTLEGLIIGREIGENGFGYDPIFFVPRLNKTVAQLTTEEKNAISHRGNALRKLKPLFEELLKSW